MSKYWKVLAILVPLIILIVMVSMNYMVIWFGDTVYLKTLPVDPTDIFRGDYVRLRYEIQDVTHEDFQSVTFEDSYVVKTMYAVLKPEKDYYTLDYIVDKRPKGGIYIQCKVQQRNSKWYDVDYGISRFYVKENTGKALERAALRGQVTAKLKVFRGRVVLVDVKEN